MVWFGGLVVQRESRAPTKGSKFVFGALLRPSKSGLRNEHIVQHIVSFIVCFAILYHISWPCRAKVSILVPCSRVSPDKRTDVSSNILWKAKLSEENRLEHCVFVFGFRDCVVGHARPPYLFLYPVPAQVRTVTQDHNRESCFELPSLDGAVGVSASVLSVRITGNSGDENNFSPISRMGC